MKGRTKGCLAAIAICVAMTPVFLAVNYEGETNRRRAAALVTLRRLGYPTSHAEHEATRPAAGLDISDLLIGAQEEWNRKPRSDLGEFRQRSRTVCGKLVEIPESAALWMPLPDQGKLDAPFLLQVAKAQAGFAVEDAKAGDIHRARARVHSLYRLEAALMRYGDYEVGARAWDIGVEARLAVANCALSTSGVNQRQAWRKLLDEEPAADFRHVANREHWPYLDPLELDFYGVDPFRNWVMTSRRMRARMSTIVLESHAELAEALANGRSTVEGEDILGKANQARANSEWMAEDIRDTISPILPVGAGWWSEEEELGRRQARLALDYIVSLAGGPSPKSDSEVTLFHTDLGKDLVLITTPGFAEWFVDRDRAWIGEDFKASPLGSKSPPAPVPWP